MCVNDKNEPITEWGRQWRAVQNPVTKGCGERTRQPSEWIHTALRVSELRKQNKSLHTNNKMKA